MIIMHVGLPSSPSNLSYSYRVCNGTHVLTAFNWSNQMESGRSLIEGYADPAELDIQPQASCYL